MSREEQEMIEDLRLEAEKRIRKAENLVDEIYQHIQENNSIMELIAEGFRGDKANKYLNKQEEMITILYQKNMQYLEDEKETFQDEKKQLNLREEGLHK